MNDVIIVKPEKCAGCNACIRACPISEANITRQLDDGRFIVTVNADKCIACGACIKACPNSARDYIDDTEKCMAAIDEEPVIVLVSPALRVTYPTQWKGILDWFKKKKCLVYDVGFGADICSWAHLKAIEFNKLGSVITQPCSAVVNYIEMYKPMLLQNVSTIHSPECCSAIYISKYQKRTQKIAFLSPCPAKKREIDATGLIQFNVTFKKLMDYFDKNDIRITNNEADDYDYEFEGTQGLMGSVYSRPGGLKDNLTMRNPSISAISSEGPQRIYDELDKYAAFSSAKKLDVFDVMSCEYGCNDGAGTGKNWSCFDLAARMQKIEANIKAKLGTKTVLRGSSDERLYKKFDNELELSNFIRTYRPVMGAMTLQSQSDVEEAFSDMHKTTEESRNINCGACGYKSCRQMAESISKGRNVPINCAFYARSVLLSDGSSHSKNSDRVKLITDKCKIFSERLSDDLRTITNNIDSVSVSVDEAKDRIHVVSGLLKNVIDFCSKNPEMDKETVTQLKKILEATSTAFAAMDEYLSMTDSATNSSKKNAESLQAIIGDLNDELFAE